VQSDNSSFYQDTVRQTKQTAFFASVDFDLIPKVLTITAGTRHFLFENLSAGSVCPVSTASRRACRRRMPQSADSLQPERANLRGSESGTKSRGNLTWHVTPDVMVYYTFSQGFRPGGFNQNGGVYAYAPARMGCPAVPNSEGVPVRQPDQQ
jgi:iron complex outermembrane receptor protein